MPRYWPLGLLFAVVGDSSLSHVHKQSTTVHAGKTPAIYYTAILGCKNRNMSENTKRTNYNHGDRYNMSWINTVFTSPGFVKLDSRVVCSPVEILQNISATRPDNYTPIRLSFITFLIGVITARQ